MHCYKIMQSKAKHLSQLAQVWVPKSDSCFWQGLFSSIPESIFRSDISSTQLRKKLAEQQKWRGMTCLAMQKKWLCYLGACLTPGQWQLFMTCCLGVPICDNLFAVKLLQMYMHRCIIASEAGISAYINMCIWPHWTQLYNVVRFDWEAPRLRAHICSLHSRKHEGHAESSLVLMLIPEATRMTVKVVFCILAQANATQLSCPASSMRIVNVKRG